MGAGMSLFLISLMAWSVGGDGHGGGDEVGLLDLAGVHLGLALLGVVGLAGEDDEALLVGLEAGNVGGERLLGKVLAAVVDGNTDGGGVVARDTGLLLARLSASANRHSKSSFGDAYLELGQGEATALTHTAVVLDGRASHNRAEHVERARGDGSSLSLTRCASRLLLAGLS